MMNKKGYTIKDVAPIAVMLGVAIIATVVMANVVSNVAEDSCASGYTWNESAGQCQNSTQGYAAGAGMTYSSNISVSGLQGLDELGSWFDTIGLVIAAAVIIGILVYAFSFKGM